MQNAPHTPNANETLDSSSIDSKSFSRMNLVPSEAREYVFDIEVQDIAACTQLRHRFYKRLLRFDGLGVFDG